MLKISPHSYWETDTQKELLANIDSKRDWAPVLRSLARRFAVYRGALPKLARINDSPEIIVQNRIELIAIYESQAQLAQGIREKIRKLSKLQCPYCGEPASPTHIDHFLPKAIFPEFSFFSRNLVPSCDGCNQKRPDNIWDEKSNARTLLNPYLDEFLGKPFFHLHIQSDSVFGYEVPIFIPVWDQTHVPDASDRWLCAKHFTALNLMVRIRDHMIYRFNKIRLRHRDSITSGTFTTATLESDLTRLHQAEIDGRTPNSWDALAFRSILRCPPYLLFLCTEPIDPNKQ